MTLPSCPVPLASDECIQMAHGGGGRYMQQLLHDHILPLLGDDLLGGHDAATLSLPPGRLAFTTDAYVVTPLQFPGGCIGSLAINGTVNDLAVAGAVPQVISVSLILEEGLPIATLREILVAMRQAADTAGVKIVTGDTKVVNRGRGDGLYVNTSGIGVVPPGVDVHPSRLREGDAVLVSGDIGRHGIAILASREGLAFEPPIQSDCAPLHREIAALRDGGIDVHCARDITRGGLAAVLHELVAGREFGACLSDAVPVSTPVQAACEVLGLDPLFVACEGRMVVTVAGGQATAALEILQAHNAGAALIGQLENGVRGVVRETPYGVRRRVDLPSGEQLPRIC